MLLLKLRWVGRSIGVILPMKELRKKGIIEKDVKIKYPRDEDYIKGKYVLISIKKFNAKKRDKNED